MHDGDVVGVKCLAETPADSNDCGQRFKLIADSVLTIADSSPVDDFMSSRADPVCQACYTGWISPATLQGGR
jgi:hypothetical protein